MENISIIIIAIKELGQTSLAATVFSFSNIKLLASSSALSENHFSLVSTLRMENISIIITAIRKLGQTSPGGSISNQNLHLARSCISISIPINAIGKVIIAAKPNLRILQIQEIKSWLIMITSIFIGRGNIHWVWAFILIRDALLSEKWSFFEHCSKGLWPPPPFYLNICPILQGVFFERVFEHLI